MKLEERDMGSVSVVITTYNRPDFLRQALQSVIGQTYPIKEIIVVDDCSPNPNQFVLKEFPGIDIIYVRLDVNSGANAARNKGITIANADWVAFLDDDDVWLPGKIGDQLRAIALTLNDEDWLGALCAYRLMETSQDRLWGETGKVELDTLKSGNPYCGASGLIVKRNVISEVMFDESLPCGQDWDIFVRLSEVCDLLYIKSPMLLYRRGNHEGLTVKAKQLEIEDLNHRLKAIYKHREWLGESAFRRRVAMQTLAYIWHKEKPLSWIKESIRLAGVFATVSALCSKLVSRIQSQFLSRTALDTQERATST